MFTIRKKSDAPAIIMEWKGVAEGQSHTKLLQLRTDNGGEFTSSAFKSSMALMEVELHTTKAYTTKNKTALNLKLESLVQKEIPTLVWPLNLGRF